MAGSSSEQQSGPGHPPAWRTGLKPSTDTIDVTTWAGSISAAHGVSPRVRFGRRPAYLFGATDLALTAFPFCWLLAKPHDTGLPSDVEYQALVQLGSSLCMVNDAEAAVATHRHVAERWPDRAANRLFPALALLDAGRPTAAATEALTAALTPDNKADIDEYRRALTAYTGQLNE